MKSKRDRKKYTIRESKIFASNHRLDNLKNRGFNYKGKQIKKSISHYILEDPIKNEIINSWESLIFELTERTKMIKKTFNYTIEKNFTKFN
jgi:hypothetical protein